MFIRYENAPGNDSGTHAGVKAKLDRTGPIFGLKRSGASSDERSIKPIFVCRQTKSRDNLLQSSLQVLFGSLAIVVTKNKRDGRPMTLRHQVSLILRFGRLVDLDQQRALILDAELCAAVF